MNRHHALGGSAAGPKPEQRPAESAVAASSARRRAREQRHRRVRIGATAGVAIVVGLLAVAAVGAGVRSAGGTSVETIAPDPVASAEGAGTPVVSAASAVLYVHVLGAVRSPGLYSLSAGARVVDAIAAAGGFGDDADPATVNLARPVTDGEQIVVGSPGDAPTAPSGGSGAPGAVAPPGAPAAPGSAPVNLNTATPAELESLPRIGPALAQRIVQWRTDNGPFRLVDELLDVPGIGDAILAGLDGLVTI